MIINSEFDPNSRTVVPGGGGDGGNAGGVLPSLGGYYVNRASERWRVGLSLTSYFGLGLDYGKNWVGRYFAQEGSFITLFAGPSAAYRVNDWLSVGAGVGAVYGGLKAKSAIRNLEPGAADGRLKFKDSAFGVGGNVGVLIEPWDSARFGITYYSPVDFDFQDHPDLKGEGPGLRALLNASGVAGRQLGLDFTLPQWVMVSAVYEPLEKLALMANANWQEWSQFGYVDVSVDSLTNRTINADYDDTFHLAVGAHYQVAPAWLVMAGFAYDSSPTSKGNRSVALPLDQQFRYALGAQYTWNESVQLGLAYEFIDAGSADISQSRPLAGTLVGDYSPNHIQVVNVNVVWKF